MYPIAKVGPGARVVEKGMTQRRFSNSANGKVLTYQCAARVFPSNSPKLYPKKYTRALCTRERIFLQYRR